MEVKDFFINILIAILIILIVYYLFTTLGSTTTIGSTSCYIIDSNLRVMGATTGFTIDIPIRFAKKV